MLKNYCYGNQELSLEVHNNCVCIIYKKKIKKTVLICVLPHDNVVLIWYVVVSYLLDIEATIKAISERLRQGCVGAYQTHSPFGARQWQVNCASFSYKCVASLKIYK